MEIAPSRTEGSGTLDTAVLQIEGMHCSSCASLIEETLLEDLGVTRAEVHLQAGRAVVSYDRTRHTPDDLCDAVAAAGYVARVLEPGG